MTPEPELEAPVLDIQHDIDPAKDHGPAKRIPHMGHALLFFIQTFFCMVIAAVLVFTLARVGPTEEVSAHPGLNAVSNALGYVLTLALSFQLFPRIWQRSFLHGIQWNVLAAHRWWTWIVPSAIALSVASQWTDVYLKTPGDPMLEKIMQTQHGAWLLTAFGVLLGPLIEEIAFRGFLLPALSTAYDWLSLERTPAAIRQWDMTSGHTKPALAFGMVFSSVLFALFHAPQLHYAWAPIAVIFAVGLAFAYVRVRTYSVACSTLMHAVYNLTIFAWILYKSGGYRHMERLAN